MTIKWRKQVVYDKEAIRFTNPVPELINTIQKLLPNDTIVSDINTIITELYNNSVDHGLLDLSSEIKQQENGLDKFYQIRDQKLKKLDAGYIVLIFGFNPITKILSIEVSDTGDGFDFEQIIARPIDVSKPSGRGLLLINHLANNFAYDAVNNILTVEYLCMRASIIHAAAS